MRTKQYKLLKISLTLITMFLMTGCTHTMGDFWEGVKTGMRTFNHHCSALFGKDTQSRLVSSNREFFGEGEEDFIPLNDQDIRSQFIDYAVPQAKDIPGAIGGKIPGIKAFSPPSKMLATLFTKIYFHTDKYVPKSKEQLQTLKRIANYLKKHPNTYVFIEGHCDQRASEAYNLSLGTRRSNYVRNVLVKNGVNPDQLFTVSYGKERLEDLHNNESAWAKNRRVAFKIYEKRRSI